MSPIWSGFLCSHGKKKIPELDTNLSFVFSILVVDSMKEALENMIDGVRIGDEL